MVGSNVGRIFSCKNRSGRVLANEYVVHGAHGTGYISKNQYQLRTWFAKCSKMKETRSILIRIYGIGIYRHLCTLYLSANPDQSIARLIPPEPESLNSQLSIDSHVKIEHV